MCVCARAHACVLCAQLCVQLCVSAQPDFLYAQEDTLLWGLAFIYLMGCLRANMIEGLLLPFPRLHIGCTCCMWHDVAAGVWAGAHT